MRSIFFAFWILCFCLMASTTQAAVGTSEATLKLYQAYLSPNGDCSDAVLFLDPENEEAAGFAEVDMNTGPTIGSGPIAEGFYKCVIFKMSDSITFTPNANDGTTCVAGVQNTVDICKDNGSGAPEVTDNNGTVTTCTDNEDTVWVYVSTFATSTEGGDNHNAFSPPVSDGDADHAFNLEHEVIISGDTEGTFIFNTDGKIEETTNFSGSHCEMNPPTFAFTAPVSIPDLSFYENNKTDQFLTDLDQVNDGQLYRGTGAFNPHTGAHVYFDDTGFTHYIQSEDLEDLPKIYAATDGIITRVDTIFPQNTGNSRYGVWLKIAENNGNDVIINYSIEPFLAPGSDTFFEPFILVEQDDVVRKGDVIAYMYSNPSSISADCDPDEDTCDASSVNAHIHFELASNGQKMSPSIFTPEVMATLNQQMNIVGERHKDCHSPGDGGDCNSDYDVCADNGGMGFELDTGENPFGTSASSCL